MALNYNSLETLRAFVFNSILMEILIFIDCVKDCKGKASGEYQSCKTCGGYVTCVWGILYERQCPAGLEWNDSLKVCDWPNAAGCAMAG